MIGGIIWLIGMAITGSVILRAIRKIKNKHPDIIKKHRFLFVLSTIILCFFGFSLSMIIGGMVNGAEINLATVMLVFKVMLGVIVGGILVVFATEKIKK